MGDLLFVGQGEGFTPRSHGAGPISALSANARPVGAGTFDVTTLWPLIVLAGGSIVVLYLATRK